MNKKWHKILCVHNVQKGYFDIKQDNIIVDSIKVIFCEQKIPFYIKYENNIMRIIPMIPTNNFIVMYKRFAKVYSFISRKNDFNK